ncbi:MAG TPA: YceI family protein [Gemmatimonadaceae bacterium]|nr:YceI family protein [Gemmatimonadaceae bacterium]
MNRLIVTAALFLSALAVVPNAAVAQEGRGAQQGGTPAPAWTIDKTHSELTFGIRHIVSRVRGTFRQWSGTVTIPDPAHWERGSSVDVTIQTASIFTDNEKRDAHLRTSDFFLADSFPTITFRSTRIERAGTKAKIHGHLTMRGVTKPVVLDAEFLGLQGGTAQRIGFAATTTINRLDYGVAWNRALEGGGVTLGDEVEIGIVVAARR